MKIIKLVIFLCISLCSIATEAMEVSLEKEKQLVNGILSEYQYLRFIEAHPHIWGAYSTMLQDLRMADYANYDEDLYILLLDELTDLKIVLQRSFLSDRNLRLLKEKLKRMISDSYYEMQQGKSQNIIRESKTT